MADAQAVYGIALTGLGAGPVPPSHWPHWSLVQRRDAPSGREGLTIWEDSAWIGIGDTGEFRLDRARQLIELFAPSPWSPDALLHPGLAPAAAVVAHWMGRCSVHCSAVLVDGRAWGLLGDHAAGKSTTAAHLARLGCHVLTDDLLIIDRETAFAGPRSIDLRGDAAQWLGGRPLGRIGSRERWRQSVDPGVLSAPLAGWVELGWSPEGEALRELGVVERLRALDRAVELPPAGDHLLLLADRPAICFRRARSAPQAARDAGRLLDALTGRTR